ncbi:MAG: helix-turn-helix transcriptional regulator [Lachnospiraceae bacterium]|nr:helix-turn-helix transcriptional regulator [Lachnospiraceae bacterium]
MMFSDKMVYLRRKSGCSQETLAEVLNVSRQTVSKWELGTSLPTTDMIVALSDFFHVSTDFLLRDDFQIDDTEGLAQVVIKFLNSAQDMEHISKELVLIAKDGQIDENEKKRLSGITETIDEIQAVINEIQTLLKLTQACAEEQ